MSDLDRYMYGDPVDLNALKQWAVCLPLTLPGVLGLIFFGT